MISRFLQPWRIRAILLFLCLTTVAIPAYLGAQEDEEEDEASAAELLAQGAESAADLPSDAMLVVEPMAIELQVGEKARLNARVVDRDGAVIDGPTIVFFSRNRRRVEVNPAGEITAHGPGEFTIVAIVPKDPEDTPRRAESLIRQEITVTIPNPPIATVEITKLPRSIYAGTTLPLAAKLVDTSGVERIDVDIDWSTGDSDKARHDGFGFLELTAPGKVTLTATAEQASDSVTFDVLANPVASFELVASETDVRTGDVVWFEAVGRDSKGKLVADLPVQFSVSGHTDPTIIAAGAAAQVEQDGAFVAERSGTYTVAAVSGSFAAQQRVKVRPRNVRKDVKFVGQGPVRDRHTSDLWIWEGADGRDYAITGTWGAEGHAYIWDVTNPENIALIDTVKVDARTVNDVKISEDGKLAVISREGASNRKNGFVILDVSEPQVGVRILSRFDDQLRGGVHNVFIHENHVYALSNGRRFDVINIEDPKEPYRVGRFELDTPGHSIHDVWVDKGIAYTSNWTDGVVAIDVGGGDKGGAPNNPVKLGSYAYPSGWNHAAYPYRSKSTGKFYVFGGDEAFPYGLSGTRPGEAPPRADGWIHIVEWNEWDQPREVARYRVPEAGTHNLWIEDDVLYIAYYNGGLRVVDVSGDLRGDLYRQGREIAMFIPNDPESFIPNAPFVWGPQPYKGHIFFSDWNSGLWAVKLEDPEKPGQVIGEPQ
jgi:hypothetical protein